MLKLGTPLSAAFIPLVPEASKGRSGVFNHNPPRAQQARQIHVVILHINDAHGIAHMLGEFKNSPDHALAVFIARMGLAAINHLERSGFLGERFETIEIGKQKIRPFVGRRAPRETDRQDVLSKVRSCALRHFGEQLALGQRMSALKRNVDGP